MSTTPVQPTQAPSLLTMVRQADGSIRFTWENNVPTGLQMYTSINVGFRVAGAGTFVGVNTLGYPSISNQHYTQYVKPGGGAFLPGVGYEMALRAYGPAGWSDWSNTRSVPALETPAPTLSSVTRTSAAYGLAVIAQNPNPPATVDAVYAYIRKPGTGPWGNSVNRTTSSSQIELSIPLPDGKQGYEVALRSSGPAGWSDYSTIRTVGAWWEAPTAVPDLLPDRNATSGDTTLTWGAGGTARAPRLNIEIWRAAGSTGQFQRIATIPGSRLNYIDTTGSKTRDYRYRVRVVSHAGTADATTSTLQAVTLIPTAPSNVNAAYAATNRVTSTWTRNVSTERPITAQQHGWQLESANPDSEAAWTWTSVGSTATSNTVTVGANRRVRTAVRASNAAGQSEIAISGEIVTTTPAAPASLSAAWSGDDILVSWPAFTTVGDRIVVEFTSDGTAWFPLATLAPTARSARHAVPVKASSHTYRARVESDADGTPDSATVTSAVVPGLTKPAPPTVGDPEAIDATEGITFPVVHNPLDGSTQTAGQLRHRTGTGAWTTITLGASATATIPAGTYANGTAVQVQAWTAGQSGEPSDWSPVKTITLRARPVPVLTGPAALVASRTATTTWAASGQTSAVVELLDALGRVLEVREAAAGTRSVTWVTALEDQGDYTTRLVVRDAYQPSLPVVRVFSVDIDSPDAPTMTATFDHDNASVAADITGAPGEHLELWRLDSDSVWRAKGSGIATPTGLVNLLPQPRVTGAGWHVARAQAAADASARRTSTAPDPVKVTVNIAEPGVYLIQGASSTERTVLPTPGAPVTLSAWVRPGTAGRFHLSVYTYDAAGTLLLPVLQGLVRDLPGGTWTRLVERFTPPANTASIRMVVNAPYRTIGESFHVSETMVTATDYRGDWFAGAQGVASVVDQLPPLAPTKYRARAHNAAGGWADSDVVEVDATSCDVHINHGVGLASICRGGWNPSIQISTGRRKVMRSYVGDDDPSVIVGTKLPYQITASLTIDETTGDTPLPQWEAMAESDQSVVWRDPAGRVMRGTVTNFSADDSDEQQQVVGFTFTRTREAL